MIYWLRDYWVPVVACLVGAAVLVTLVILVATSEDTFKASCEARGGQVLSKTKTDTGFDTSGKPVFVTSTTRLCVVEGNVVDIG